MRSFLSVLGALAAFTVVSVSGQEAAPDPACVDTCNNEVRSKFTEYGCNDATQAGCLCTFEGFRFSVRDCAVARCIGTTEAQVSGWLDTNFCVGVPLGGGTAPSAPAEPVASTTEAVEEPATSTTVEESTAVEETATEAPTTESTSDPATETAAATTTTASEETQTPVPAETSEAEETTQATETSNAETSETSVADEEQEEDDDGAAVAAGGLSQGAAVGIGIGVAVVVLAIAAIAIAILLRKRKQKQRTAGRSRDISRPIADVGRGYGSGDHGSYMEKRGESFEMTSNRYEDMVPRQVPRTMV